MCTYFYWNRFILDRQRAQNRLAQFLPDTVYKQCSFAGSRRNGKISCCRKIERRFILITLSINSNSYCIYIVVHKKRATLFSTITLVFLDKFLLSYMHLWKQKWILYREYTKCTTHLTYVSTLPGKTKNNTKTADIAVLCSTEPVVRIFHKKLFNIPLFCSFEVC